MKLLQKTELVLDSGVRYIFRLTNFVVGDTIVICPLESIFEHVRTFNVKKFKISVLFYFGKYEWVDITGIERFTSISPVLSGLYIYSNSIAYHQYQTNSAHSFKVLKPTSGIPMPNNNSNVITWLISIMLMAKKKYNLVFDGAVKPKKTEPYTSLSSVLWFDSLMRFVLDIGDIKIRTLSNISWSFSEIIDEYNNNIDKYIQNPYNSDCIFISSIISSDSIINTLLRNNEFISIPSDKRPIEHAYYSQLAGNIPILGIDDEIVRLKPYKGVSSKAKSKPIKITLCKELKDRYTGLLIVHNNCILRFNDAKR